MKRKETFDLGCNGQGFKGLEIGVMGDTLIEWFSGKLSMFKVYDSILTPPQLARLVKVTSKFLDDGLPTTDADDDYAPAMTVDRRFCISECTSAPRPGTPGAPEVPSALNALADSKPSSGTGKGEGATSDDIEKDFPNAFTFGNDVDSGSEDE